jgi:hypothetical protein
MLTEDLRRLLDDLATSVPVLVDRPVPADEDANVLRGTLTIVWAINLRRESELGEPGS